jgi:formate dehydrogenase subunit delta
MNTAERVVLMANQIARNFSAQRHEAAAAAVADHIAKFWDPRMKAIIFDLAEQHAADLTPVAADAVRILREHGAPPSQTRATVFEHGRSDAG